MYLVKNKDFDGAALCRAQEMEAIQREKTWAGSFLMQHHF